VEDRLDILPPEQMLLVLGHMDLLGPLVLPVMVMGPVLAAVVPMEQGGLAAMKIQKQPGLLLLQTPEEVVVVVVEMELEILLGVLVVLASVLWFHYREPSRGRFKRLGEYIR